MTDKPQQPKGRGSALSSLNTTIDTLNIAREVSSIAPAKAAFGSTSDLLTLIKDLMISEADYVELGLTCAGVCEALNQEMDRRQEDQLSQSVLEAIEKLTTTVAEIQRHIIKWGKRNAISRRYHAKDNKHAIATWRLDLNGILRVFDNELVENTHPTVSDTRHDIANVHTTVSNIHHDTPNADNIIPNVRRDVPGTNLVVSEVQSDIANPRTIASNIHRDKLKSRERAGDQNQAVHASAPGESPVPLPRTTDRTIPDIRRDVSEIHRGVADTQAVVYNIRNMLKDRQEAGGQPQSAQNSVPGELPPPPPRIFFGRNELIEKIVHFAEHLTPIALIGVGGIGKTSIVLSILHDDRIKQRFGDNRWFIRCDQFPASHTHFLRRLSKVIGAGIENPADLTPLRRYLSSKEMVIVLDNAESILDPQGMNAQEIHAVVDELTRFSNVCLCITSRISIIPPGCEAFEIPTLSMEAACDTFYCIYKHGEQSNSINDMLEQLDFHPLSITLLATVAQYNKWGINRLTREWERQRTGVLHAQHSRSLATTIELSLASPMLRELGPDARGLLEVVAFFPQGVDEKNVDWLFPTASDGSNMFDTFCILSLTYRSNGFITMLAPLRDYLRPKDPMSSLLLGTTRERYFSRLSLEIHPDKPGFEESQWIISEDANIEYLLDVFTSIDASSKDVWNTCANFINHLCWHKPRLIVLGPKIEALPDDHPSKAQCFGCLSRLFRSVGNRVECKRLLTHTLKLWRDKGDDRQVALTLGVLSDTNRYLDLLEEGTQQAKEASEIFEQLGDVVNQAGCLVNLAWLLLDEKQLEAAEEAASRAIHLLPEEGEQFLVCDVHRVLGNIYRFAGKTEKAIHHLEVALGMATSLNSHAELFQVHFSLAMLFFIEGRLNDSQPHVERAKSHAVNDAYSLACTSWLQALWWGEQCRFEEAKSEALRALDVFEKLGAANDAESTRWFLEWIDRNAQGNGLGSVTPSE